MAVFRTLWRVICCNIMKVGNKIYNSLYGLNKVGAIEKTSRDHEGFSVSAARRKTFAETQSALEGARLETGFQTKLDPRIAIALSVANSNKLFSLEGEPHAETDIIHDNSLNRGKTTNIEV